MFDTPFVFQRYRPAEERTGINDVINDVIPNIGLETPQPANDIPETAPQIAKETPQNVAQTAMETPQNVLQTQQSSKAILWEDEQLLLSPHTSRKDLQAIGLERLQALCKFKEIQASEDEELLLKALMTWVSRAAFVPFCPRCLSLD